MDRFIRPHQQNTQGFWKTANGGNDSDEADPEDQSETQVAEAPGNLDYTASQASSLAPNDSISQIQPSSAILLNPFLEPPKLKRQRK
jgi:hypothetical protein